MCRIIGIMMALSKSKYNLNQKAMNPGWLVWGSASLFFSYQFIIRVFPNIVADELMVGFHVDACALGA